MFARYEIDMAWLMRYYVESEDSLNTVWCKTGIGHRIVRKALWAYGLAKDETLIQNNRTLKRESTNTRLYGHPNPNSFAHSSKCSQAEREIAEILTKIGIDFVWHDKTIIAPKELDFYFPDLSLALEYNGEHWHDREKWELDLRDGTEKSREAVKTRLCRALGIELVHIWESDWLACDDKQELLRASLNDLFSHP